MRLLNVDTLQLTAPQDAKYAPRYAILSHTWGDEEVSFQDLQTPAARSMKGFRKILACCKQATKDGIKWVWIDTCCIDKTSSSELSEAINSMFNWYFCAAVCYAFLEDVPPRSQHFPEAEFRGARWFTRGWCLQELLAPKSVEFYSANWTDIGTKWSLQPLITEITGIPMHSLHCRHLEDYSVAQKMSWASNRTTTRDEDLAYCLLGIFGINMPLLYGEGQKTFLRLQREILTQIEDYSFLIWTDWTYWENDDRVLCVDHGHQSFPHSSTWAVLTTDPTLFDRMGPFMPTGEQCQWEEIKLPHDSEGTPGWSHFPLQGSGKPHQLTSRGLNVQMFARTQPLKSDDAHQSQYDLWTGYIYRGMCLCICLTLSRAGTSWTYGRSQPHQVHLVDAAEIRTTFQLTELYLTTNTGFFTAMPALFLKVSEREDLMVVLSSKRQSTVTLVECCPPIRFFHHDLGFSVEAPWDAKRLYSMNLGCRLVEAPSVFSLTFRVCIKESIDVTTEADVVVTLWVEKSLPHRCCISLRSGPGGEASREAAEMDVAGVENVNNGNYARSSDRAYCQLPDNSGVVSAMVKGCQTPPMKADQRTKRRSPAFCTLYVADLGNGLSIEESSTGGNSDTSVWDLEDEWQPDSGTEDSSEGSSMETDTD